MLTELNVNTPYPTDDSKEIYSHIRNIKERFGERFGLDHYIDSSQDTSLATADGYHKYLVLPPQTTFPALPAGASYVLFTMLINNIIELCCRKSDGVYQLTRNGQIRHKYDVGDTGPGGGTVRYRNNSTGLCLEAAPDKISARTFSSVINVLAGATGTAIGTGLSNTNLLVSQSSDSAAHAARSYLGPNNMIDWFLPSRDEVSACLDAGINGYPGSIAWTSTEVTASTAYAYGYPYPYNPFVGIMEAVSKSANIFIIPMRSFTDNTKYKKIG